MSAVLGVSLGASATRLAFPHSVTPGERFQPSDFDVQSISTSLAGHERRTGEYISAALDAGRISRAAIAYRTTHQATAMRSAMAWLGITDYRLVQEVPAALALLETSEAADFSTIALFDLGASSLTVTIADPHSREIYCKAETPQVSGRLFDKLIRENQLASGQLAAPRSASDDAAINSTCEQAKIALSTEMETSVPGTAGILRLTRGGFERLIGPAVARAVEFLFATAADSPRQVQAVIMIGGGSHVPLICRELQHSTSAPVVLAAEPESVIARGAALAAGSTATSVERAPADDPTIVFRMPRRRARIGTALKAGASILAITAVAAVATLYWRKLLPDNTTVAATESAAVAPASTGSAPATTTTTVPAPLPAPITTIVLPPPSPVTTTTAAPR